MCSNDDVLQVSQDEKEKREPTDEEVKEVKSFQVTFDRDLIKSLGLSKQLEERLFQTSVQQAKVDPPEIPSL